MFKITEWWVYILGISIGVIFAGAGDAYNYCVGNVETGCASGTGEEIILHNNKSAIDPTWQQVQDFTANDFTDWRSYDSSSFICGDAAAQYHDAAEVAGFKCAFVHVRFEDDFEGHACNAFNTTDKGLIFIDCLEGDSKVKVEAGKPYKPKALRDSNTRYASMGIVSSFSFYW